MNEPRNDEAWVERARALLDESTRTLDAATLSRLNRARQAALAQPRKNLRVWMIGSGLAAAAALAIAIGVHQRGAAVRAGEEAAALQSADIDLLTQDDDALDLYENLDFYAWLGAQDGPRG